MDLRGSLRRFAFTRPAVLLVESPAGTEIRLAVERFCRERGWPVALSPADADALVIAGQPSDELAAAVDVVWRQTPQPAVRMTLADLSDVQRLLATVPAELVAARQRTVVPEQPELPMAETGPDRDGLELDVLHVVLGPVLSFWPAGLRLRLDLQGDVVTRAAADSCGVRAGPSFWDPPVARRRAAHRLDSAARLMAVAGWSDGWLTCQVLRDRVLSGEDASVGAGLARLRRRARRQGLPRAMLDGRGDPFGRLVSWLDDAADAVSTEDSVAPEPPRRDVLRELADLVVGADVATARLVVAAVDPDLASSREPADGH